MDFVLNCETPFNPSICQQFPTGVPAAQSWCYGATHKHTLLTLIVFLPTSGPKSSGGNWDQTIDQIVDDIVPRPSAACFALQNEGGSFY